MWFNSKLRAKPYQLLTCILTGREISWDTSGEGNTDAAWLSSARVVRCWVKSRNERNPCCYLPSGNAGHYNRTAGDKPEEGRDDVKSSRHKQAGLHT